MAQIQFKLIFGIILSIGTLTSAIVYAADAPQETSSSPAPTRILQFREANFSKWNEKVKYNSTALTNPKGMEPLYNITNTVLDFFLGKQPIPDGKFIATFMTGTFICSKFLFSSAVFFLLFQSSNSFAFFIRCVQHLQSMLVQTVKQCNCVLLRMCVCLCLQMRWQTKTFNKCCEHEAKILISISLLISFF